MQSIKVLDGTQILTGLRTAIIPDQLDNLKVGEAVSLEFANGALLVDAVVRGVVVQSFAQLHGGHFRNNSHPDMGNWAGANATLKAQDADFNQLDWVTVLTFEVADNETLSEPEEKPAATDVVHPGATTEDDTFDVNESGPEREADEDNE